VYDTKFIWLTMMIYHKICIISLHGLVSFKMILT